MSGRDWSDGYGSLAHTPGPWRLAENEWNKPPWQGGIGIEAPNSNRGGVPDVIAWMTTGGPSEVNARLIAAAPDLLEALKLLYKEMQLSGIADAKDYGWPPAIKATIDAIAKAEGQS